MNKKVVGEVFSQVSKLYDPFLKGITLGNIDRWQRDLIELLDNEGNRLDVGTGTGEVLKKSIVKGLKVGIDLSIGMLKRAKTKCTDCHFILADAENMPFKDASFRSITLSLVYRHIDDKKAFLKEAYRVLEKGGHICILDINRFLGTRILTFIMRYPIKPLGLLMFGREKWDFFLHSLESSLSLSEVKQQLEGENFKVIHIKTYLFGLVYLLKASKL